MLHNFTLRQLAYFVTAAECGSTSGAAELLHLNQSSMSSALTELESAVGVALFVRRQGKGLSLTAAGEELLPPARRALHSAEEFDVQAKSLQGDNSGVLRLGCFETITPAYLPRLAVTFQRYFPDVDVQVLEATQKELIDALNDGRIELAITYDHELPSSFSTTLVAEPVPHVLVSSDHPRAKDPEVSLRQFRDESFVMIDNSPARELIQEHFAVAGFPPKILHSSSNFDHVRAIVHENMGYSMLSQVPGTSPPHWGRGVVAIPIADLPAARRIVAAAPGRIPLSRRAQNFRALAAKFPELSLQRDFMWLPPEK